MINKFNEIISKINNINKQLNLIIDIMIKNNYLKPEDSRKEITTLAEIMEQEKKLNNGKSK